MGETYWTVLISIIKVKDKQIIIIVIGVFTFTEGLDDKQLETNQGVASYINTDSSLDPGTSWLHAYEIRLDSSVFSLFVLKITFI